MIGRGPLAALAGFVGCAVTLLCVAFSDSEVARGVLDALRNLATVGGVVIAALGLSTWRRSLVGKERFEACRKLLEAVLRLRNEIATLRHPFQRVEVEGGEDVQAAARRHDIERFNAAAERLAACEAEVVGVEVLLGREVVDAMAGVRAVVGRIRFAIEMRANPEWEISKPHEIRSMLYETSNQDSKAFTEEIRRAIARVEAITAPVVRDNYRW